MYCAMYALQSHYTITIKSSLLRIMLLTLCTFPMLQNVLENYPQFLALLGLASVHRPAVAAVLGAVRLIGFIGYVRGYSKGDPKGRINVVTASGYIGLIGLLGLSVELALRLALIN
jgi:MAPEG family